MAWEIVLSDIDKGAIMNQSQVSILSAEFYKILLDCLFDAVYTVDQRGTITYWNDSCARITGYTAQEMLSRHWRQTPFANRTDELTPDIPQLHGIEVVPVAPTGGRSVDDQIARSLEPAVVVPGIFQQGKRLLSFVDRER